MIPTATETGLLLVVSSVCDDQHRGRVFTHSASPAVKLLRNVPDFCNVIAQSDPTTRVRQSRSVLPAPSRCLQGPADSLLPTRATAQRIKNSCPLSSSGEQTLGPSPFHWRPGWNPKRPLGWASSSPPQRTEDSGAFLQAQRHFCLGKVGGGGGASVNFLHCGVGTIIFYSTGFQTPSDNNTKAAAPAQ